MTSNEILVALRKYQLKLSMLEMHKLLHPIILEENPLKNDNFEIKPQLLLETFHSTCQKSTKTFFSVAEVRKITEIWHFCDGVLRIKNVKSFFWLPNVMILISYFTNASKTNSSLNDTLQNC